MCIRDRLRAEKGFIIVGQDTDGSVTPDDLGMGWCVGRTKPFSWIGWRGMNREDCLKENRKQLIGLKPLDPNRVLPEGAQLVFDPKQPIPMTMVGHVTSSYMSAAMGYSFAMALVRGGPVSYTHLDVYKRQMSTWNRRSSL